MRKNPLEGLELDEDDARYEDGGVSDGYGTMIDPRGGPLPMNNADD